MKRDEDKCLLRDTPADENEIAMMLMHRMLDTSPGNPWWYRRPTMPKQFIFKPGAKPVFPAGCACRPNRILPVLHAEYLCQGGPFGGELILLSAEGQKETLTFTLNGETGFYQMQSDGLLHWQAVAFNAIDFSIRFNEAIEEQAA